MSYLYALIRLLVVKNIPIKAVVDGCEIFGWALVSMSALADTGIVAFGAG